MKKYRFYLRIFPEGNQYVSSFSINPKHSLLVLILDQLGHSAGELSSFKDMLLKVKKKRQRALVGYNTLAIYVNGENSEIGQEDFKQDEFKPIPTEIIENYIDDAIAFINDYNKGSIPGIIPESQNDHWSIIPNEYVKEEWWDMKDKMG